MGAETKQSRWIVTLDENLTHSNQDRDRQRDTRPTMAPSNPRGLMRPHHSRSPPFLVIGLAVVVIILGFNYWSLSSRNSELGRDLQSFQDKFRITALKKMSTDRQNEQLLIKVRDLETSLEKAKNSENQKVLMHSQEISKKVAEVAMMQDQLMNAKSELIDLVSFLLIYCFIKY